MTATASKGSVGELLISGGVITREQLEEALSAQSSLGLPLGETLIRLGMATPAQVFPVLQSQMNVPWADLSEEMIDAAVVSLIPRDKAERYGVLALFRVRDALTTAMQDPRAIFVIDELEQLTGCRIQPVLVSQTDVRKAIHRYYTQASALAADVAEEKEPEARSEKGVDASLREHVDLTAGDDASPVVNLVNLILGNAVREGASDIHIEPTREHISVRYRIDGVLREVMTPKIGMHAALISRLKVMTKMDIAEHRRPQDGRMMISLEGRQIDVRASCMPTTVGQKIALRILDQSRLTLDLDALGMSGQIRNTIGELLSKPHGIVLVTGPTGSGKTTTLYCMLDQLRGESRNIVSVEDPVEYDLELVNQVQVNEAVELTFATALRTFLRQDPDYIMVGEIRDTDTARIAVQAALTGHLVLSTLHTNDAISSITRLTNMGADPVTVAAAIRAVVSQRLVRTNCARCAEPDPSQGEMLAEWHIEPVEGDRFMRGAGCDHCFGTGHRGRLGVYEIVTFDEELRTAAAHSCDVAALRGIVRRKGMTDLFTEGVKLVRSGRTTLTELLSVVTPEERCGEAKA